MAWNCSACTYLNDPKAYAQDDEDGEINWSCAICDTPKPDLADQPAAPAVDLEQRLIDEAVRTSLGGTAAAEPTVRSASKASKRAHEAIILSDTGSDEDGASPAIVRKRRRPCDIDGLVGATNDATGAKSSDAHARISEDYEIDTRQRAECWFANEQTSNDSFLLLLVTQQTREGATLDGAESDGISNVVLHISVVATDSEDDILHLEIHAAPSSPFTVHSDDMRLGGLVCEAAQAEGLRPQEGVETALVFVRGFFLRQVQPYFRLLCPVHSDPLCLKFRMGCIFTIACLAGKPEKFSTAGDLWAQEKMTLQY
jgi:hypothetical protein